MNNPTDEELDALVVWLEELPCCHDGPHETSARCKSCEKTVADAIITLRAQLAEAKADKEKLGRELNLARYGQPDFSWQVHKEALAAANARADRAEQRVATLEAALATQPSPDVAALVAADDIPELPEAYQPRNIAKALTAYRAVLARVKGGGK